MFDDTSEAFGPEHEEEVMGIISEPTDKDYMAATIEMLEAENTQLHQLLKDAGEVIRNSAVAVEVIAKYLHHPTTTVTAVECNFIWDLRDNIKAFLSHPEIKRIMEE